MELPLKVEGIMFCKRDGEYLFLILLRAKEDGAYWQPLTGTVRDDESLKDCLKREVKEETAVTDIVSIIDNIWHFHWEWDHEMYLEFVYGIEMKPDQEIKLSEEHRDYAWLSFEDAIGKLSKENNKKAFMRFKEKVIDAHLL